MLESRKSKEMVVKWVLRVTQPRWRMTGPMRVINGLRQGVIKYSDILAIKVALPCTRAKSRDVGDLTRKPHHTVNSLSLVLATLSGSIRKLYPGPSSVSRQ